MCNENSARGLFSRAVGLSLLFSIVFLLPAVSFAMDLLIGTGEIGSFSHFAGRTLCRTIDNRLTDVHCEALPAPDDLHNLTNLQIGSLDLVLVDSCSLHDAVARTGEFRFLDFRFDNLRAMVRLYEVPAALVVRDDAGISSIEDLTGKRLNIGAPGSPENRLFSAIMNAKGWSVKDFSLVEHLSSSQSVDSMAFCHGTIQVMLHIGIHPDAQLLQMIRLCGAHLIDGVDRDIAKLIQKHPAYSQTVIAPGTYPSQEQPVSAIGSRMMVIASEALDEQTAYRILEAMAGNRRRIESAHPALSPFDAKSAAGDALGIPLHPGVARYLDERGF
jgi:TRAP transporter TAXI family solute receptor